MNQSEQEPTVLVRVPVHFVEALLRMHDSLEADLSASVLANQIEKKNDAESIQKAASLPRYCRYSAEYLGEIIGGRTLPEVFASAVDLTATLAPEALVKLADMRARTRRYISSTPESIHPGNRALPVTRTASGWWISKNIGQEDLRRALKALCRASELKFGIDVKFPVRSPAA